MTGRTPGRRRGEVCAGQSAAAGEATVQDDCLAHQPVEVHLVHRRGIAHHMDRRIDVRAQ